VDGERARHRAATAGGPMVALVALAAVPILPLSGSQQRLAVSVCLFGMAALGLTIVWGFCGQPSFGHAALTGVGAYTVAILTVRHGMGGWAAVAASGGVGLVAGAAMGLPGLRVRADGLALVTFALGEGLRVVEGNTAWTGGSQGLAGVAPLTSGGRVLLSARDYYPVAAALLAVAYLGARWLRASPLGWSMLALGRDPVLAASLGVRAAPTKLAAWSMAGLLTGLAGGVSAAFSGFVSSVSFGVVQSFQLVVMVVLGGLGRPGGAVVGAMVVLALDDQLQAHPAVRLGATGAAMIAVVIVRSGAAADSGRAALLALRRSRPTAPA